ncbi:hypothetical protein [Aeromicrobium sp.]|uniref:hypothetical protein n=1 Tax=Aeromicrobium sp. TaxID=1871063 RepID=UPI0019AFD48B|nr:hypothetical protein [Aeromicrobium sp.]MBC7631100.1 hypothetical protein [Aeromicrobium sp.]
MSGFNLRSGGYWLGSIGFTDALTTRFAWSQEGGGFHEASWEMDLPLDFDHPALQRGALVEVMDGGLVVGQGHLSEPGRIESGKSFTAQGIYREAEHYLCFTGGGASTTILDTAITSAISYGAPFTLPTSIATSPMITADAVQGLNHLDVLATSVAVEQGKRWFVDADGGFRMVANDTAPTWQMTPGTAYPGVADDDYATHLFARYNAAGTLTTRSKEDVAASQHWGYRQFPVDLTPLGAISTTRVDNRLAGMLARGKARLSFTERIEVGPAQLLTAGGRPADLSMIRGGQVVRVHGLDSYSQWLNGLPYLDFVIGECEWINGSDSIWLTPEQFSGRSLADRLTVRGSGNLTA